jgi:hypothetical protein
VAKRVSLKGKGADLFFGDYEPPQAPAETKETGSPGPDAPSANAGSDGSPATVPDADARRGEVPAPPTQTRPRRAPQRAAASPDSGKEQVTTPASMLASTGNIHQAAEIEAIRKTVKTLGREVSFVRLTPEEKGQLADVVYTYKRQGQKTSENEINRIAINYLLADYHANGEQSVLAQVLAALRA